MLGMYLRTTRRRNQDGSIVEYYQLAETRWDPVKRRPTAQIIHNFGRADTMDRDALRRLARSITRVCDSGLDVPEDVAPPGEALEIEWARPLGVVHVARALWEELGIGEVLRSLEQPGPRRAPHELALFTMVANRLAEPLSKLACHEHWVSERVYLPEAEPLTLQQLYFALDVLAGAEGTGVMVRAREHQTRLISALEASQFFLVDAQLLMAKMLATPVLQPQFGRVLEKVV
jgi:hypothetical protein